MIPCFLALISLVLSSESTPTPYLTLWRLLRLFDKAVQQKHLAVVNAEDDSGYSSNGIRMLGTSIGDGRDSTRGKRTGHEN